MNKEQRQQDLNDMFIMAADRECIDVCEYLLSLGADVNAKGKNFEGYTPLHWAARLEKLDMCKFLLDNGADMHIKDNWGITPLKIVNKNTKIYKLFKKYFKD